MSGLWASPNRTAFCSLVWRSHGSKARLPAGPVMSWRRIIKGTSVQLSEAPQPTRSLLPNTEHAWTSQSLPVWVCFPEGLDDGLCCDLTPIKPSHSSQTPAADRLLSVVSKHRSLFDWQLPARFVMLVRDIFWCASLETILMLCGGKIGVKIWYETVHSSVHLCALKFNLSESK